MGNSLVTVIIPTYNRASTIERAIRSVLNQTYENLELIIVDDASTDNTIEVIAGIEDSRMRFIKHDINKGGGAARNTGIKVAKGDFIAFQDSDDEWMLKKLETQVNLLLSHEVDFGVVYSKFIWVCGDKEEIVPRPKDGPLEGDILRSLLKRNFVTTQTAVVRRICFESIGYFDERLQRLQDWELWLRVAQKYKFVYANELLVKVYAQSKSISSNLYSFQQALEIIAKKHSSVFKKYNIASLANHFSWLSLELIDKKKSREATEYSILAIKLYPWSFKLWFILLRVLLKKIMLLSLRK